MDNNQRIREEVATTQDAIIRDIREMMMNCETEIQQLQHRKQSLMSCKDQIEKRMKGLQNSINNLTEPPPVAAPVETDALDDLDEDLKKTAQPRRLPKRPPYSHHVESVD